MDSVRLLYIPAKLFITVQGLRRQTLFRSLGHMLRRSKQQDSFVQQLRNSLALPRYITGHCLKQQKWLYSTENEELCQNNRTLSVLFWVFFTRKDRMAWVFHIKNLKLFYGSKTWILLHVLDFFPPPWADLLSETFIPRWLSVWHLEEWCGSECRRGVRLCSANLKPLEDNQEKALAAL